MDLVGTAARLSSRAVLDRVLPASELRSFALLDSRGGCPHVIRDAGMAMVMRHRHRAGQMRAFFITYDSRCPHADRGRFSCRARDAVVLDNGALLFDLAQASIPFRGSGTSACSTFGPMSEIWFGGCLMWKSRTRCCIWRCRGWGKQGPASWKSAGNATAGRPRLSGRRDWLTREVCREHWNADFPLIRHHG
jgi:hypothetical protein